MQIVQEAEEAASKPDKKAKNPHKMERRKISPTPSPLSLIISVGCSEFGQGFDGSLFYFWIWSSASDWHLSVSSFDDVDLKLNIHRLMNMQCLKP